MKQVRLQRGLVNETDAWQQSTHERLAPRELDMARLADPRPLLFDSLQSAAPAMTAS